MDTTINSKEVEELEKLNEDPDFRKSTYNSSIKNNKYELGNFMEDSRIMNVLR